MIYWPSYDSFKMVCFVQRRDLYIEKHYNPAYHKAFVAYLRYGTAITVPYYVIKAASPEHYIWRTQEDNKVRLTHAANNGKVFAWDKPPATGHPGQQRNCRCWAEPVMVIIEDLSKVEALIKMTDTKTWPEPPINGILREGLASKTKPRNRKEKSLYDQYGGE
ncbi:Phage head morphogenesis domain protein [Candidatus Trichorickettsia mobilis]|uniref:Phage head morphogenesis domain protein n=1 Tax=Candidatus Trichorickettsia mobilis TaxID=1346319 RepID=A0ABZ0US50_9RICK|nr:phage minor head protein [Candidatus Trichorickettsia mobilis]WPY00858.1 Phage head morphogenesis domain protein [Candidatus Trichorickettsia mobilis]